ncbi:CDPK-related kinase 5 isoform X2 [Citrus clementina]|uniref:CDPK-related kinase 5 isoform X2 n=1 Tax=Citrus clementina TaxID=85681 RepID=UPI000CECF069|nr:CDPK-related kinase 5 isoform X2 [Citrus x clementina]
MGGCTSKPQKPNPYAPRNTQNDLSIPPTPNTTTNNNNDAVNDDKQSHSAALSPFFPLYTPSPAYIFKKSLSGSKKGGNLTPMRVFRMPPSPAKHIKAVLRRRKSTKKSSAEEGAPEEAAPELDKRFGFSKEVTSRLEVGEEVGRGHFGYTCTARYKKGEHKDQKVAVKVIPKSKMTTAIAVEDVRREVKILRALSGHSNLVKFYDAFEDLDNVYIVMDYFLEQNFLYTSKDESSQLKAIDFGLSDFVRPDERLNDIVGSAYYVAPEVLHRSYGTEADVWSIGVIAYILLCGSRPFWARTESGIFRAVLKADPSFDDGSWPSLSSDAKDFVKLLLNKDPRKRMTAAQALSHPWIRNYNNVKVPLDISILKLMKAYMQSSSLRRAALKALSKTLTVDERFYLKEQFALLEPNKNGCIAFENIKTVLMKNATDAMKESRISDLLAPLNALQYRAMDFEEFCAAALNVHQLEALDLWEQHARSAYELFEKDGNRAIVIDELASELGLAPSIPLHVVLNDWIRHTDGKLSFHGFVKLLHGVPSRTMGKPR